MLAAFLLVPLLLVFLFAVYSLCELGSVITSERTDHAFWFWWFGGFSALALCTYLVGHGKFSLMALCLNVPACAYHARALVRAA